MYGQILVAFLKAIVLAHVVQVIAPDHNRSLHLHLQHNACQDSSTNAHIASEWTLLVNVVTFDSLSDIKQKSALSNGTYQIPIK